MHFKQTHSPHGPAKAGLLFNRFEESIRIAHEYRKSLQEQVDQGRIDALLIEPEDGFSLLGGSRGYLSEVLGLEERNLMQWALDGMNPDFEQNLSSLADWSRHTDPDVTLLGIPSRRKSSLLKGLVLVPYEGSLSYKQFAQPHYHKPYRDFFYNVTYEAMYYAYTVLKDRKLAISHLSSSKYAREGYRMDITRSQIDAIVHFCNQYQGIGEITFWDDGPGNYPVEALRYMNPDEFEGQHRDIDRVTEKHKGIDYISLSWPLPPNHNSNTTTSGAAPKRTGSTEVPTPLDTNKRQPGTS